MRFLLCLVLVLSASSFARFIPDLEYPLTKENVSEALEIASTHLKKASAVVAEAEQIKDEQVRKFQFNNHSATGDYYRYLAFLTEYIWARHRFNETLAEVEQALLRWRSQLPSGFLDPETAAGNTIAVDLVEEWGDIQSTYTRLDDFFLPHAQGSEYNFSKEHVIKTTFNYAVPLFKQTDAAIGIWVYPQDSFISMVRKEPYLYPFLFVSLNPYYESSDSYQGSQQILWRDLLELQMLEAGYREHEYNINMRLWNRTPMTLGFEHKNNQVAPVFGADLDSNRVKALLNSNISIDLKASPFRLYAAETIDDIFPTFDSAFVKDFPGVAGWLAQKLRAPIIKPGHFTFRVNSLRPINNGYKTYNHSDCHRFITGEEKL